MPARIELADGERLLRHAVDLDGAAVGGDDAAHDLHERGFAGAIFANDADDLAWTHLQVEACQRDHAGIDFAHAAQPQERLERRQSARNWAGKRSRDAGQDGAQVAPHLSHA